MSLVTTSKRIQEITGHDIIKHALLMIETHRRGCQDYELVAIAQALNVSPLWLLGLTDDPTFNWSAVTPQP